MFKLSKAYVAVQLEHDGQAKYTIMPSSARDLANTAEMHSGADFEGRSRRTPSPFKSVLPDV